LSYKYNGLSFPFLNPLTDAESTQTLRQFVTTPLGEWPLQTLGLKFNSAKNSGGMAKINALNEFKLAVN
jgi:hypothetical protein